MIRPIEFEEKPFKFDIKERSIYDSNCVEFWLPVTNMVVPFIEPNRYWISSFGNAWDTNKGGYMKTTINESTKYYAYIHFRTAKGSITRKLHRIEMMTFMNFPGCEKYEVNHIDGVHTHNELTQLEWVTSSENRQHSINLGLEPTIFGKPIVQLSQEEVKKIKLLREQGFSYNQIVDKLNLRERGAHRKLISKIVNGKSALYSKYY